MPSRRFLFVLLPLLLAVALTPPAFAQGVADAYTVRGVEVDTSAANANAAKTQAVADAQRQAFQQLLERLTSPADIARLPKVDAANYVRDYGIEQERTTAVRYVATLTVRFNPTAVKKLLRDAGVAFTETRSRVVVVVPVLTIQGRQALWDDPNPWRSAWGGVPGGLVPLVVPSGDLTDLQNLTAAQALAKDPQALANEGARWRTPDVLVAAATLAPDGRRLDVALFGLPGTPQPFDSVAYDLKAGETADQMMLRAARDVARAIDTGYKQANLMQFDRSEALATIVPLGGLEDWLAVRERLGRVPQVRGYEVVSLSKSEADLVLHIAGDQDKVKAALATAGLPLEWVDGNWTMHVAGRK